MSSDAPATVLEPDEDLPMIARERFLSLAAQLQRNPPKEWGPGPIAESAAMQRMGLDKSQVGQLKGDAKKSVGLLVIAKACKALGLSYSFFFDPTLGKDPDYREHPSPKASEEMRLIRDGERSPYEAFERYIADQKDDITPAHVRELRAVRFRRGDEAATYNAARGLHSGFLGDESEKRGARGQLVVPADPDRLAAQGRKMRARPLGRKSNE